MNVRDSEQQHAWLEPVNNQRAPEQRLRELCEGTVSSGTARSPQDHYNGVPLL